MSSPGEQTDAFDDKSPLPPGALRAARLVFISSTLFFALLGRGTFFSPDESGIFNTGLSLVQRNALALTTEKNQMDIHRGKDGQYYSHREILPILATMSPISVGTIVQAVAPAGPPVAEQALEFVKSDDPRKTHWSIFLTMLIVGPLFVGGVVTLVYLFALRAGAASGVALALSVTAALGTPFVVYAKTIFPQVPESLFLMLALYRAEQFSRGGAPRAALNVGLACAMGMMSRSFFFLVAFYFFIYVLATARRGERLHAAIACVIPMALAAGVVGYVNWLRWGNPIDFGHHGSHETFSSNPGLGVFGLLVAPGKGLFVFAPVLSLVVACLPKLWRRGWQEVLLMAVVTLSYLGVYGSWYDWMGGLSWGPRFLLPVIAPWIALLARTANERGTLPRRLGLALLALAVLGFVVQLPGVLVNPHQMEEMASDAWSVGNNHLVTMGRRLVWSAPDDLWILSGEGTSPYWGSIGFSLGVAFIVAVLVFAVAAKPWR